MMSRSVYTREDEDEAFRLIWYVLLISMILSSSDVKFKNFASICPAGWYKKQKQIHVSLGDLLTFSPRQNESIIFIGKGLWRNDKNAICLQHIILNALYLLNIVLFVILQPTLCQSMPYMNHPTDITTCVMLKITLWLYINLPLCDLVGKTHFGVDIILGY